MPTRLSRRAALAGLASLAACGPTSLAPLTGPPHGRVVLLRGLLNVFSTGLNFLTADLRQVDFDARVRNYVEWPALAEGIAKDARDGTLVRPFAIIGHSYGADDAVVMANHLGGQGIGTDLLVTFDPTSGDPVGAGVVRVLNFYQDRDAVDRTLESGPGFTGTLENRLVPGESHISIDKQERLHAEVVALLQSLATERQARATRPVAAAPMLAEPVLAAPPMPVPPRQVRAGR
ncbi:hypothetical protein GCM10011320_50720 [Neoroseomonas lacus]|uniref:Thioesterase domain-containing protein n=1 Tax=Neoroseomonas lacus TaxID=287609 RepID=A0A917NX58_9PROT|nr:hypothetical protein GCM10011320_50720 [Neoroseomonas lacus]